MKYNSPEFSDFLTKFQNLHASIVAENRYASFFAGDFNGHSQFWWADGDTIPEGMEIEEILSSLNLCQMISEPSNFIPCKRQSCIDLI